MSAAPAPAGGVRNQDRIVISLAVILAIAILAYLRLATAGVMAADFTVCTYPPLLGCILWDQRTPIRRWLRAR